jgi:uncharacterized protein (DUF362 family)/NAD-dependent dihydropyrimidine dehydrogenase PreA subunit
VSDTEKVVESGDAQVRSVVSVVSCQAYDLDLVRRAVDAVLAPLGGIRRFVRPGMRVLLKPNLLNDAGPDRGTTTHPTVVRSVAEQVREAGGTVLIGDSPGGPIGSNPRVWRASGMVQVADQLGAHLVPFDRVVWKRLDGADREPPIDYFIAAPVLEADLVIDLPKLKTHILTFYTGAVKNLYGTIPGTRKRELHLRAPGVVDFSPVLVDVLELVRPGLTILDGVLGVEGNGPGFKGTPRHYGCLAASADPVAVDTLVAQSLGYRAGEVLHLDLASARGLGVSNLDAIRVVGGRRVLDFGQVELPKTHWYYRVPSWASAPLRRFTHVRPRLLASACIGCGRCAEVCPRDAIAGGRPPVIDLDACIGCFCCVEICPQGAIELHRGLIARLAGMGR